MKNPAITKAYKLLDDGSFTHPLLWRTQSLQARYEVDNAKLAWGDVQFFAINTLCFAAAAHGCALLDAHVAFVLTTIMWIVALGAMMVQTGRMIRRLRNFGEEWNKAHEEYLAILSGQRRS